MDTQLLLTPGPTPIHPRATAALSTPMRGHMDPEVFALNARIQAGLRELFRAPPGAFACLLAGTGSLGMEAGFTNLVEPGDAVLVCANGEFGLRMAEMARRVGARVRLLQAKAGEPVSPEAVAAELAVADYKVVALVHGETSTGVLNPVRDIARLAAERGALVVVDTVATVGMVPFEMGAWGVDYAYTGSQKCLSAPPGVAPAVFSSRAIARVAERRTPPVMWYTDLDGLRAYWDRREYHHTVPVQLHYALEAALAAALEEGVEARFERARKVGAAVLAALQTMGFRPFVEAAHRLPTVLAVSLPSGLDDAAVRASLRARDVVVAGGLGETAGRIWRLGLMGEAARPEVYARFLGALEEALPARGLVDTFDRALGGEKVLAAV